MSAEHVDSSRRRSSIPVPISPTLQTPKAAVVDDHSRVLIVCRLLAVSQAAVNQTQQTVNAFNHVVEKLRRIQSVSVSDSADRSVYPCFVVNYTQSEAAWGCLQAHRRPLGLIAVAFDFDSNTAENATDSDSTLSQSRTSPTSVLNKRNSKSFDDLSVDHHMMTDKDSSAVANPLDSQYSQTVSEWNSHVLDSRLVLIGNGTTVKTKSALHNAQTLRYQSMSEMSAQIESDIRDFIKVIFWVLEKKRLDLSFEKMDVAPCPVLPMEDKYRVGVENKHSKPFIMSPKKLLLLNKPKANSDLMYRRKCIGRCRKQVADYTLMSGLAVSALDAYNSAIELLREAKDMLWLAAAYEGWACAALSCKYYDGKPASARRKNSIFRVSTFSSQLSHMPELKGHKHSRSVGSSRAMRAAEQSTTKSLSSTPRGDSLLSAPLMPFDSVRNLHAADIIEKFRLALENYERYSFAASIEYECVLKASTLFREEKQLCDMELFLRERVGKYLEDSFTRFDMHRKAIICRQLASINASVGFKRKCAFYLRLSALFQLNTAQDDAHKNEAEFRAVYPVLYAALEGFGISHNIHDQEVETRRIFGRRTETGWVSVHSRALQELYTMADRSGYVDAAIRHVCHLLQVYIDYLDTPTLHSLCTQLAELCHKRPDKTLPHLCHSHVKLNPNILLPPVIMTNFPVISAIEVCPLPAHLSTTVVEPNSGADNNEIFIYTPFKKQDTQKLQWVVGCECTITLHLRNPLPFTFNLQQLRLDTNGDCAFECEMASLSLPAAPHAAVTQELRGVAKHPGELTINGYSCRFLSIQNSVGLKDVYRSCRIQIMTSPPSSVDVAANPLKVQILPAVPQLGMSLPPVSQSLPVIDTDDETVVNPDDRHQTDETKVQRLTYTSELGAENEMTIYSGQSFTHILRLQHLVNAHCKHMNIERMSLTCQQPRVSAGPKLIEFESTDHLEAGDGVQWSCETALEPSCSRDVTFRMFGLDPITTVDGGTAASMEATPTHARSSSAHYPVQPTSTELIPYTGRLMTATISCKYDSMIDGTTYTRNTDLPLHVMVIPAVTVQNWHVIPADTAENRYLVLDLINHTEWEAEIAIGEEGLVAEAGPVRTITVQSKETCRVPVPFSLCAVEWRSFVHSDPNNQGLYASQQQQRQRAAAQSHIQQHAVIHWCIPAMNLRGSVPVGSLLTSWSLLRQLLTPPLQMLVYVQDEPEFGNTDLNATVGQPIDIRVQMSAVGGYHVVARLRLCCLQDAQLSDGTTGMLDRSSHILMIGSSERTATLGEEGNLSKSTHLENMYGGQLPANHTRQYKSRCDQEFRVTFLHEGTYKMRASVEWLVGKHLDGLDIMFIPTLTFSVSSR